MVDRSGQKPVFDELTILLLDDEAVHHDQGLVDDIDHRVLLAFGATVDDLLGAHPETLKDHHLTCAYGAHLNVSPGEREREGLSFIGHVT